MPNAPSIFIFLCFLGNQLLMSKDGHPSCLDGQVPCLAWIVVKQAVSARAGLVSERLPTAFWLSDTQILLYSPSSKLCSDSRKLSISVLIFLWALCFSWSYDDDVAYSDTGYGFGTNLEEGLFILVFIRCAVDYVLLRVNLILLVDSKWTKSWRYWSVLLPQTLHSPSTLGASSADG